MLFVVVVVNRCAIWGVVCRRFGRWKKDEHIWYKRLLLGALHWWWLSLDVVMLPRQSPLAHQAHYT